MYTQSDNYLTCEWCGRLVPRTTAEEGFLVYGSRSVTFSSDRITSCINCAKDKRHIVQDIEKAKKK